SGGGLLLFSGDLVGRALLAHGTHRAPLKHRPVALAPCAIRPWSTALSCLLGIERIGLGVKCDMDLANSLPRERRSAF
ncbi:MAG TPA: hypothetical protein VN957_23655, partial [Chthoniobacterales bacterium]|nr:hypothetical protein [Chthoniobacterales bacterium]